MLATYSAIVFSVLCGIVALFHIALAAGLPWGAASMGGKFPGKYPPLMRVVAVLNAVLLTGLASIVLIRAGLIFPSLLSFSAVAIWVVVVSFVSGTIMNIITPSKIERIWAPVAFIQLLTSLIVAIS